VNQIKNIYFVTEQNELQEAITFLAALPIIALDTETTGVDPHKHKVLLISAGNKYKQFVFDVARIEKFLEPLRTLLQSKPTILHNAKFDYKMLKQHLNIELESMYDTMLAEQLLLKGRKAQVFGLDDVAYKYMNVELNKDIRKSFITMNYGDNFSNEQITYSAEDVQYLEEIKNKQQQLLNKYGLSVATEIEMGAIAATGDMELNGIYLSPAKWHAASVLAKSGAEKAKKELDILFSPITGVNMFDEADINYNSPKQLLPVIQAMLKGRGKNLESTSEEALKEIDHPAIKALLTYREHNKRLTTYGAEFLKEIHPITGRIHTTFHQLYTDTGRYSSSNPLHTRGF